jgi:hypothetical protein
VNVAAGWEWDDTLFSGAAVYHQRGRLPHAPGLADVFAEVLRLDGRGRLLARVGFSGPERHVVPGGQALERTSDDVVAWVFSMSSSAPHLFGAHRDDFETDLRRLLREVSPPGRFSERQPSTEVFIWWQRRTPSCDQAASGMSSRLSDPRVRRRVMSVIRDDRYLSCDLK